MGSSDDKLPQLTFEPEPEMRDDLDPPDWDGLRTLGHRALDEILDHIRTVRQRPIWQPMPAPMRGELKGDPPWEGVGLEAIYEEFLSHIKPYALGNIHPRFWGWVPGAGTPGGVLAELLKAGLNSVSSVFDEVGRTLEQRVISWFLGAFGLPPEGSGILVSGGSMANFAGLAVARDAKAGFDVRDSGLSAAPERLTLYASEETHSSVDKAIQLLGMGRKALRKIPVDGDYRIRLDALREAIDADRAQGCRPLAIVGNAGTVNTGAIDDLRSLGEIAEAEALWLHVDGAFGAVAALSPKLRPLLAGMERADSLAFDFHKWLHVPYHAGCTLFRDEAQHRATFSVPAAYLDPMERGVGAQSSPANQLGPELSREAKALTIWMSLREHGLRRYGQMALRNVEQARYLAGLVTAEPRLELLAPVSLNIVCLRYVPEGHGSRKSEVLNALNREILMALQEEGIAVPSHTVLQGRFAIRVCITNHRSRFEDFDLLVREILRIGECLRDRMDGG
jgi:glutamate/tyrosine decarboxylase-like PLP-dependent enzyme